MSDFAQPIATPSKFGASPSQIPSVDGPAVLAEAAGPKPSLTTEQIWKFSRQFRDDSMYLYFLWFTCFDAVTNWRRYTAANTYYRAGAEVAWFNRSRDAAFDITSPMFRTISAVLALDMPVWGADPAVESPGDIAQAEAAKIALRYDWRRGEMTDVYRKMIDIGIITGTSAVLTYMKNGNVAEEAFAPDRIRAEPGIGDPDESRFLAVTRLTTKAELAKLFPDKLGVINNAPRPETLSLERSGWTQLPADRVEVLEAYCRSGHWYLMIGPGPDQILAKGITPNRCMPIEIHRYTEIPGQFFGTGAVEKLLPVQHAFNAGVNQILRNGRQMNNPKWAVNRQSHLDPGALTSTQTGEIVFYDGNAPQQLAVSPMSQYAVEVPNMVQAIGRDSLGVHGVVTGAREVGVVTGAAVNAMTANDKAQFQVTMRDVKKIVQRKGRVHLLYMIDYMPPQQIIHEFDRYGTGMYQQLKVMDLGSDPSVFIEANTLFSSEIEARQTRIMAFVKDGAITPKESLQMLRDNVDPLFSAKPVQDYKEASDALSQVVANGYEFVDPRRPPVMDPVTGEMKPATRKVVTLYATDNFELFADVVKSFMRSPKFNDLSVDRQDDVEKFFLDILDKLAPPPAMPPGPSPASRTPSAMPSGPSQPSMPTPKAPALRPAPTPQHKAAIANDRAEVAG